MHNFRLWFYLVCGLTFATISHAQTATVYPVGVNSASINSTGQVVSMQTFRATYAGQPDSYYSRAVAYNKATTGKLGKARAFVKGNALNLGIVAATLALGYALDEITKDIYSSPPLSSPYAVSGSYYWKTIDSGTASPSGSLSATTAWSAGQKWYNQYWFSGDPNYRLEMYCTSNMNCRARAMEISPYRQVTASDIRLYQNASPANSPPAGFPTATPTPEQIKEVPATVATDTQIHDAMFPQPMWEKNGYLGDNLPELLRDPVTGATELTQEVQDVATQVQNEVTAMHNPTATPVTAPTVSPNYTADTNNPAPSGMPAFCGWASAVCDFMNWFKTDTTTEPTIAPLPQETLSYTAPEWSSGLGSGSCPSPNTISVLGGSFEISYQPFCTLAEMIKYLVLALAYITSAMIISGVRR